MKKKKKTKFINRRDKTQNGDFKKSSRENGEYRRRFG